MSRVRSRSLEQFGWWPVLDPIPSETSWGNGDYVLVWHNVFSTVYFLQEVLSIEYLFVAAFKFHRPSYKL